MKHVKNSFPPGTVGIPTGLQPRFWEFIDAVGTLEVPEGTMVRRASSCDITFNVNRIIGVMKGDWVFFVDDDHQFPPDTLMRLLSHAYAPKSRVDVVSPINVAKGAPFYPIVFHGANDPRGPLWPYYRWEELSGCGLFALPKGDVVGRSGMLVKRHVFDAIGYPWVKCGQISPGFLGEDWHFCREIQNIGYTIWIDRDQVLDHITYGVVQARRAANGVYRPGFYPLVRTNAD